MLDPDVADDLTAIRALHRGDPGLLNRDHADSTWLLGFTNDSGPVPFYSFDRADQAGPVPVRAPARADASYELASMEPFSFTARDGLTIHGYVTFPPEAGRSGLPIVLNVHGGPWAGDAWGFNPEAQWLANRGYLCVQVNFRGSTGYGKAFVNAGDREWGGRCTTTWWTRWRTSPARAGPTRPGWRSTAAPTAATPPWSGRRSRRTLFRCAVDIVGPSNLKTLIETIPPYWAPMIAQFHRRSATRRRTPTSCGPGRRCPGPTASASRC